MPRSRASTLPARPAALALLAGLALLGGCADDGDAGARATGRFGALHTEVCRAATSAGRGDLTAASRTFDDVHVGLHDLAAAAGEEDRAVAARLLEAKQVVEAGLTVAGLEALVPAVASAVEVTGGTAPASCA